MSYLSSWLEAARLRTLPLSSSGVILGGALASTLGYFNLSILILSVALAVFLQILSNFANDYGDAIRGSDGPGRSGPKRAVASGAISRDSMFHGIVLTAFICAILSCVLFVDSFGLNAQKWLVFLALGAMTIAAAIFYTMGHKPYGYMGLGDISVFIFFGLVAVNASCALYGAPMPKIPWLPACATGLFATAVLNINNLRDVENDRRNNKKTLVVRIGPHRARIYHLFLILCGLFCWLVWLVNTGRWPLLFLLLAAIPLLRSTWLVYTTRSAQVLDAQLRKTSVSAGLLNILLACGLVLYI